MSKRYLLIREQAGEGCDYTIGCGLDWTIVEGESLEAVVEELRQRATATADEYADFEEARGYDVKDHEMPWFDEYGEHTIGSARLYEIGDAVELHVDEWQGQWKAAEEAAEEGAKQDIERAEYERLRAKFGGA